MTRIVSGFAGSLALRVPKSGTRPTSDRVREAVFSGLEARDVLRGAHVLDLFAGSGALGLEAASRGAAQVVLVERSPAAAAICRRNAEAVVRAAPKDGRPVVDVRATAVLPYLSGASPARFDLVFVDPPYDLPDAELLTVLTGLVPLLAEDAVVCVERSTRDGEPTLPDGLLLDRTRAYGETAVHYLSPSAAEDFRPSAPPNRS
ncbi:16S rRNA (guanine(966)-N(2))-methyltransferase RsmD [Leifsonia shinshuensis]|uniref:16S rRNA (guanine(966)-N(2))-methyltransferase RsmD n=1 Tax=Leifsonia shinshuensis TaxID=150026 RepID=UPI001F50FF46|nr:16S rRNA (guanine(966)-N(2))-methyltransferase RsmD [Leifsonia shinshuensis]MCI0155203.1 16S rRNA (guanine(966)-N(2))-methyltransferase RsmD [Leifsonia shinshuensis]